MSAPTFTLVNYSSSHDVTLDTSNTNIKYFIYSDENGYFEDYYDWVQDNPTTVTSYQQADADEYSSYVLRLECDFSPTPFSSSNRVYASCCIENQQTVADAAGATERMAICLVAGEDGTSYKQFNFASEEITGDGFWASGPNYVANSAREIVYSTTTTDGDGVETTTYS